MEINRAAFGALAIVGVVAAGSGAYLANRHNEPVELKPAAVSPRAVPDVVTETENTITAVPATETVAVPVADPEPAPRASAARRAPASDRNAPAPVRSAPASQRTRAVDRPSHSTAPTPTYTPSSTAADRPVTAAIEPVESTTVERNVAPEAPRRMYDELVIPADSVIGLQVETAVSSDRAKVEDPVRARVSRDVRVRDQVAIPAGARAEGSITLVEQGGRLKDQARLGVRFHTIVLADGTRLPINTETIYREGESPARESAAKIGGGAVGGAVLGAIFGGKKGAAIGGAVGAAGGGVAVAASEANAATLAAGSAVTVRMGAPATVTVEK